MSYSGSDLATYAGFCMLFFFSGWLVGSLYRLGRKLLDLF
ncbi:hypothetical protein R77564_00254 [Ralstonia sp. LMG 32965]|uniref:Uncharacterized protein n=1 Tax=Ralstonia flatus TaxID=3058601 RepID=A0ABM9KGE8_9RALS|nr:hypothetical protein R77564_00254 [Ralstonia sp. LMG 32965]